ncbi:piezo-type mechanosensitive ion channel component isoform X2 [Bradysia coprophila]|uniref:piezo-type mechanosensitive ion channel component isoform X2 n=1 Tax=Bradysia coprophila TaxID=38358 RepID=UPI00187DC541|nr:piezo-type mechanosensitive ion channel component isoform X2 [Bradysia coprophila]
MATSYFLCMVLQRAVFSIILTLCILYHPVGLKFPYLLLLLYLPFVPVATAKTIRGHTGYYFQISIAVTVLIFLVQIAFQIVLATLGEGIISQCNFLEILLRHIGLTKFNGMPIISILEWFLSDIVMLISTTAIYLILRKLTATDTTDIESAGSTVQAESSPGMSNENLNILKKIGIFLSMVALLLASTLQPSVPAAVYFIVFLGAATWWACYRELDRAFAIICRIVLVFLAVHIVALLSYQTPWPQEYFTDNSTTIRFLGFTSLYLYPNCTLENDMRQFHFNTDARLEAFLNPVAILLCFFTLAISSGVTLNTKLMRRSMKNLNTFKTFKREASVEGGGEGSIPMDDLSENGHLDEDMPPTLCEQFCFGLEQVGDFLFKNSYILSNIIMMVWSIVYHSWITFIFLLWANLLFIIPNQRKNMLRCSPFVVIYAELLLLAQYLYGMDLTEAELPSKSDINGINLAQIGFIRYDIPCLPLLLKTLFTLVFWVTLRQKVHESRIQRQSSTLAHLAAPFQVTVGAATTTDMASKSDDKKSKFIVVAGKLLNAIFLQLWIWIVVLVLFLCAIYGQKMTAIRIVYMTLVLVFLITFQWSFQIWRKIMYAFWVVVIGFAMLTLIMIYTYQFDRFNDYWAIYFKIPYTLQTDIGLEKFKTKDLFLNLVYPTLVVIITVVQLQIFHKKYLESLDAPMSQRNTDDQQSNNPTSSVNYGNLEADTSDDTISKKKQKIGFKDLKGITRKQIAEFVTFLYEKAKEFLEFVWLFLEIHFTKVILFVAFALGIREVSILHLLVVLLASIAVTSRTYVQGVFTRCISLIIGVLLILKMIYQITYIDQTVYNTDCTGNETLTNETINNPNTNDANWFGFYKITGDETLATILKGYIAYILITTIHTIILMRQKRKRFLSGKPMTRPKVLFPRTTRLDADKDVLSMLKYLANFVFYKFGIEITLIMLVALIGSRMDIVALIYSVWLCILFAATRCQQKNLWPLFQWFVFTLIPIQYIAVIGLPPFLCVELPWKDDILKHLQEWAMLPDKDLRDQSNKLFLDFILLMFACRQMLVFRIEDQYEQTQNEFPGGSNKSVIEDIHNMTTKPITNSHDYVTNTRNWLDILKCAVFLGFYWMTLAIVFLAGTNRINVFSLGYLIGSFIFLWQGADFYLRPIHTIIRYWSYLIGYNIFVIAMKAVLQIPACIFTKQMESVCWVNQFFGISCIRKFHQVLEIPQCRVPSDGIGLVWDGICFAFLLLQLRIFQSYYFCHIINESKASTILASRGAELIEGLRRKQVKLQIQREEEILLKIKQKMDRIKANQQKFQPAITVEGHELDGTDRRFDPATHKAEVGDETMPLLRKSSKPKPIVKRKMAILSGDYYLFEDMDENLELNLLHEKPSVAVEDDILKRNISKRRTFEEVIVGKTKAQRQAASSAKALKLRCVSLPEEPTHTKDPRATHSEPIHSASGLVTGTPKDQGDDDYDQPDGQKPGPSRASVKIMEAIDDDLSEPSDTAKAEKSFLSTIVSFISGLTVSITLRLYKMSRNYRYVTKVLAKEKKDLKAEKDFGQGHRIGSGNMWAPLPSILRTRGESTPQIRDSPSPSTSELTTTQVNDDSEIVHDEENGTTIAHLLRPTMFSTKKEEKSPEEERRTSVVPEIRILAPSLERGLDDSLHKYPSKDDTDSIKDISEIEEDFYTQEHSLLTEFISALWFALISNTDLVCYLMVFINMVASASVLALPIPFMVFLWGTLAVPRPSKTFWVTIIAYTQVVVLIKCLCQFEFFWRNSAPIAPNNPLAIPRIIGLERKPNYAAFDLALLMVVFFHRFIQKQMGIWRSTTDDDDYEENVGRDTKEVVQTAIVQQGRISLALPSPDQNDSTADDVKLVNEVDDGDPQTDYKYLQKKAIVRTKKYCSSCTTFFHKLLTPTNRVTADVYVYIFLCDFTNFFVLLFGFTAFGSSQGDGGVAAYVEENKIPVAFLIMLLLQFVFIIVDRALYLRKNLIGKIIFQFITVIGMHIWLFFLVPALSERSFNAKAPPIVYYMFKCVYFLLSAYQIRCGYPRRILGNCITKRFSIFNLGAFKVYMLTPFLFELRALMDWIWTDTTMPLFEWLKMEDIFANIYEIKCSRQMEEDFPAPRGVAKRPLVKYVMGGGFLLVVIALIWGPLALFALGNTVGEANIPLEISVELKIGPYEPVYRMTAQSSKIFQFTPNEFDDLTQTYKKNKIALTFLSNYESLDIAAVNLGSNSTALWIISPPDLQRLIEDLRRNATLKVRYKYSVTRKTYNEKMLPTISMEPSYVIEEDDQMIRDALIRMLEGKNSSERLLLPKLFPKFLKVKNIGDLRTIPQLMSDTQADEEVQKAKDADYRNVSLQMHSGTAGSTIWWEVLEVCDDRIYRDLFAKLPHADCAHNLVLYTFNDKLFPETLSIFTAGGVIGIYTTFVFFASRIFRSMFSGGSMNIMYTELPFVDRILQLCLDIYLVRESMEFSLEEDLFAKLIFLYRSPETMIKWTRPADEQSNDDDTESSEGNEELDNESKKKQ